MNKDTPISLSVIGGYLGSGKTTLVRRILALEGASDTVFLVNDFGDLNIDADIVAAAGGNTVRLENGCICCTIADGLVRTMLSIVNMQPRPKRVVVEASGIANPDKIADFARLSRSFALGSICVVADVTRIRELTEDEYVSSMILSQLQSAEIIVLNKCDLVSAAEVRQIKAWLRDRSSARKILPAVNAAIPDEYLTGTPVPSPTEAPVVSSDTQTEPLPMSSVTLPMPVPIDRSAVLAAAATLPESVHRYKGFIRLPDDVKRLFLIQGVAGRPAEISALESPPPDEEATTSLVFIGTPAMPGKSSLQRLFGQDSRER